MKLTLRQILDMRLSVENASKEKFSAQAAYDMSLNISVLQPIFIAIEKSRLGLIEKYGAINERGLMQVKNENIKVFMDEFDEFLKKEEDLSIRTIKLEDLVRTKCEFSPADMVALKPLILEESSTEKKE